MTADGYSANRATLRMPASQLLGAVWYTDGSGWHGYGAGIEGTSDHWQIVAIRFLLGDGVVEIDIEEHGG